MSIIQSILLNLKKRTFPKNDTNIGMTAEFNKLKDVRNTIDESPKPI